MFVRLALEHIQRRPHGALDVVPGRGIVWHAAHAALGIGSVAPPRGASTCDGTAAVADAAPDEAASGCAATGAGADESGAAAASAATGAVPAAGSATTGAATRKRAR